MFTIRYMTALWKRKTAGQLFALLYAVPILFLVLCTTAQLLTPLAANLFFERRSAYRYCYETPYYEYMAADGWRIRPSADKLMENDGTEKLLYFNDRQLRAGYDQTLSTERNPYYANTSLAALYVAKEGTDLSKTIFSKKNFIGSDTPYHLNYKGMTEIYLSYNTAKYLKVKKGDRISIQFSRQGGLSADGIVRGFLKPRYDGASDGNTETEYNRYMAFPSLVIADEALYSRIIEHNTDLQLSAFTNERLHFEEEEGIAETARDTNLSALCGILKQKEVYGRFLLQILISASVVVLLLVLEYSLVQKKNAKDMEILGMLGMRQKDRKRILSAHVFLSYCISLFLALLLCKYIYFELLLEIYCEPILLLLCGFLLFLPAALFLMLRDLFAMKTISGRRVFL
ncbi:MAG: hypothetical protein ACLSVG_09075 [Clostridia bacterium]